MYTEMFFGEPKMVSYITSLWNPPFGDRSSPKNENCQHLQTHMTYFLPWNTERRWFTESSCCTFACNTIFTLLSFVNQINKMLEGQKYLSWANFIALVERTYYIKSTQIYLKKHWMNGYFQIQSTINYANVDSTNKNTCTCTIHVQ